MTKIFKKNLITATAFAVIITFLIIGVSVLFTPAFASTSESGDEHTHCVCGGDIESVEHTSCDNVTFAEYTGGDVTYDSNGIAYLYLASDVVNSSKSNNRVDGDGIFAINKGQTLYLCLNGHSMQNSDRTSNVIDVNEGGSLILCDCQKTGWIGGRTSGANSGSVWVKGNFTLYGGSLKNNQGLKNGGGLYLAGSGSATMYGGFICDNYAFNDGGGVYLKDTSTFTMYGGCIFNNRTTDEGGGVFANSKTTFNMNGGIIKNNQSGVSGGGVFVYGGTFTMNSGSIESNTSGRGGGIGGENSAVLTVNDGTIKDNIAYGNGGGAAICNKSTFNMNGGVIINNQCNLNGGGIFLFGNGGYSNADSTFNITGGTIKNNKAFGFGGGIYFYEYTNFNVNGTKAIQITGNEGGNLYLTDNKKYVITLTALVEDSFIGVSTMRSPWVISNVNDTDYSAFFSADSDDCHIGYNTDKTLAITTEFYKVTLKYDLNGGKGDIANSIGKSFDEKQYSAIVTDKVPTRVCYNFAGWADSADATTADYKSGDGINLTEDKTLYAVWNASHVIAKVNKVTPDCTNDGKEEYYTCECGKYYSDADGATEIADINSWGILSASHTFTEWIDETAATEETYGVKAHKDCSVCYKHFDADGNEITEAELIIDKIINIPNADDKGLSGGAVAGISIAGTVAVEAGGFAIVWFVIKKKKWADFIALFVKK